MSQQKKNRSKKGRKCGRNEAWCKKYRAEGRREKNKRRKLAKHIRAHPNDKAAASE